MICMSRLCGECFIKYGIQLKEALKETEEELRETVEGF